MFLALVKAYFMWVNNCANSLEPPPNKIFLSNMLIYQADRKREWDRQRERERELIQLTRMYIGVLLHIGLLMESLATILTGIWPSIAVYEQMCG